jgi:hypothetical protein
MRTIRSKMTYANVISTLCLFLLVGGGAALAAGKLGKNSVGTKQIKNGAVTGAKIKKGTITGTQINLAKLGTVPSASNATTATTAGTANALTPPEAIRLVGSPGQPSFLDGTVNYPPQSGVTFRSVGFYKDHEGIVHLEGLAKVGKEEKPIGGLVFMLPAGYRPASGSVQTFPNAESEGSVVVFGSNVTYEGQNLEGDVYVTSGTESTANLSGITFRPES